MKGDLSRKNFKRRSSSQRIKMRTNVCELSKEDEMVKKGFEKIEGTGELGVIPENGELPVSKQEAVQMKQFIQVLEINM